MNRQRFVKNILKMENEWLAAIWCSWLGKIHLAAEEEIAEILNNLCTTRGLHDRVQENRRKSGSCNNG